MKQTSFLISFLFLSAPAVQPSLFQMGESASLPEAIRSLDRGDIFDAIQKLKQSLQQKPSPQAHFYLSGIYTRLGRYNTAYRYLAAAMKGNTPEAAHYGQLGLIRRFEGCRMESLAAFQYALKLGKWEEATLWRHVGDVHVDLLEWDKAIEAFGNSLRLRPDDAGTRLALGRIYLERNDPTAALVQLRAALRITPAVPGLHAALGRAYRAAGELESAIEILAIGVDRDPSDQETRYILGQTLLAAGRVREGREELRGYSQLQEQITQANILFEEGVQHAQAGDLAAAEKVLRQAVNRAPRYAPALQILGTVLLNRGNPQSALELFRRSLAVNPLNSETYLNMGTAYLRLGILRDALEMTHKALVIEDQDPRHYSQLGDIYSRMNQPDESQNALEKAATLKSEPGYRPADPYASEARRRDDARTVRQICDGPPLP